MKWAPAMVDSTHVKICDSEEDVPPSCWFLQRIGKGNPIFVPLEDGLVLGRQQLNSAKISKSQAEFVCLDGRKILLRDLKSKNGTYVNGKPVTNKGTVLEEFDRICFGREVPQSEQTYGFVLRFKTCSSPSVSTPDSNDASKTSKSAKKARLIVKKPIVISDDDEEKGEATRLSEDAGETKREDTVSVPENKGTAHHRDREGSGRQPSHAQTTFKLVGEERSSICKNGSVRKRSFDQEVILLSSEDSADSAGTVRIDRMPKRRPTRESSPKRDGVPAKKTPVSSEGAQLQKNASPICVVDHLQQGRDGISTSSVPGNISKRRESCPAKVSSSLSNPYGSRTDPGLRRTLDQPAITSHPARRASTFNYEDYHWQEPPEEGIYTSPIRNVRSCPSPKLPFIRPNNNRVDDLPKFPKKLSPKTKLPVQAARGGQVRESKLPQDITAQLHIQLKFPDAGFANFEDSIALSSVKVSGSVGRDGRNRPKNTARRGRPAFAGRSTRPGNRGKVPTSKSKNQVMKSYGYRIPMPGGGSDIRKDFF